VERRARGARAAVVAAVLGVVFAVGRVSAMDESGSDGAKPLTGTPLKASGTSSIAIKRFGTDTLIARRRNVSFHLFRGLTPMLLLREEVNVEDEVPWKGEGWANISVDITAKIVGADGSAGAVRYRIHEIGEDPILYGALYAISMEGCCDSQDGHVIYSVETGKRLMYTTGSTPVGALERLDAPGTHDRRRWAGVFAVNSAYDLDVFAKDFKDKLAVITYATDQAPLMRVVLTRPQPSHMAVPSFDRLEVRRKATASGADAGVTLHVQFYDDVFADIPVVNDALDVAHATGSDGVKALKAPLEGKL
jgi:hypothetical protein